MWSPRDMAQRGQPWRRAGQQAAEGPTPCRVPERATLPPATSRLPVPLFPAWLGVRELPPPAGSGIGDSCFSELRHLPRERCPRWCLACALKRRPSRAHIHTERPVLPALQKSRFSMSIL